MSVVPINPSTSASPTDLESRVASRKRELNALFIEHKKNSSRASAAEAITKIKARLSELADIMKTGAVNGWADVDPMAKRRLEEWITR